MYRIGIGYDVHAFDFKKNTHNSYITLCGIQIPYKHKLLAHSDGDVVLHALTDAMLGSIAAGNIGTHFPPTNDQWKDIGSEFFIKHANALINDKGYTIQNLDITVICQEPKIMPYAIKMRQNISLILNLEIDQVSVKAVTTEGLGALGRQEGIAAQAIVLIHKSTSQNTGA
jgi:2-C-methyl-D-erythritol 2,4-cyclodiphosphate synthase